MTASSRLLFFALLAAFGLVSSARAQVSSPWSQGHQSRARLVAGGPDGPAHLAGVEIGLTPGYKTYWRMPGESGLPPVFDWSKAINVAAIDVLWPAPAWFEDAGGVSYGYKKGVLLPVRVTPRDPGRPVELALTLTYGVCKDICIPAQADLRLTISDKADDAQRAAIHSALRRVPARQPLGAGQDVAIKAVGPDRADRQQGLDVEIRAPAGSEPRLFVEGPDGWYPAASGPMRPKPAQPGAGTFAVRIYERPSEASGPVPLRLTLVAGDRAVETEVSLDVPLRRANKARPARPRRCPA